jgi:hypothetical protein
MFVSDELIYIQMQKTGCTHIASILHRLFDGKHTEKKHNAASPEDLIPGRLFVSSIRNPWDWYLSLWTFGVQGGGGFMQRLTRFSRDAEQWRSVYDDAENISSFRKWLRMVHTPSNYHDLGEGYGETAITGSCGFMTHRYLYLCNHALDLLKQQGRELEYSDVLQHDQEHCYIDFFIRQENLENSLCEIVERIRPLSASERNMIYGSGKTNASQRKHSISDYYDADSIALVSQREKLIIDKFSYEPPSASI